MRTRSITRSCGTLLATLILAAGLARELEAQVDQTARGSSEIELLAHIPLGASLTVSDLEMEQEISRPYVYVGRMFETGFDVISIADPGNPQIIYRWRIENAALHRGTGAMDAKYFKLDGRYYLVQSMQFQQGGPNADLGAVVVDVTDLPDPSGVREVGRIRYPEYPGGFHNIFIYKHSSGQVLLITTTNGPFANVYDMGRFLDGDESQGLVAQIPVPETPIVNEVGITGYHDFYAGFDPATGQDKFYGGGAGGYYVYDISNLDDMRVVASVTGVPGVTWGHTVTPSPDGRYIVGETEYQYAPLRIYDLKPALDGEVAAINLPISAWTANWKALAHNHEVRWPYVFVSSYEDGLQIFNMRDPEDPYTVAYFDTFDGPHKSGMCADLVCNGAFGVDVRNADGLIVVSDMSTGFWAFRWEGFEGWNGHDWGMPNISSVQDWENGPEGADRLEIRASN